MSLVCFLDKLMKFDLHHSTDVHASQSFDESASYHNAKFALYLSLFPLCHTLLETYLN
jgi:hypothetical protein